mgnify:CR=1 FL=1
MRGVELMENMAVGQVIERPKFLETRDGKGRKYAKIMESLNLLNTTQCLCYSEDEFVREFGKFGIVTMKQQFKKSNFRGKVVLDNGKVYVWKRSDV